MPSRAPHIRLQVLPSSPPGSATSRHPESWFHNAVANVTIEPAEPTSSSRCPSRPCGQNRIPAQASCCTISTQPCYQGAFTQQQDGPWHEHWNTSPPSHSP